MSIRILIADDHRILRAGLKTYLNADENLEIVGEASSGDEAVQMAQSLRPDIILLDIGMPGMDAMEATRLLVQSVPDARVLILTMHEDRELVQESIRSGASGYIIKRAAESELIDAIYAIWRGMVYIHPSLMRTLMTPPATPVLPVPLQVESLTAREVEILRLIAHGNTNRQIAAYLSISVRTVETHRSNLMEKLNLHSRVDLFRYATEHGLLKLDQSV